jgi:hypothetical protein
MASYDFDYAIELLRQATDFAEIERDFIPLRKWANEVEKSAREFEAVEIRLNKTSPQDFLLETLQSVATGVLSPDDASRRIRKWLNTGQMPEVEAKLARQYQFA